MKFIKYGFIIKMVLNPISNVNDLLYYCIRKAPMRRVRNAINSFLSHPIEYSAISGNDPFAL